MSHFFVICFDICNKKRLRRVSKQLENFGQRVQYSMFECHLDQSNLQELKSRIEDIIDPNEDHVRYYSLCHKDQTQIIIDGRGEVTQNNDFYLL